MKKVIILFYFLSNLVYSQNYLDTFIEAKNAHREHRISLAMDLYNKALSLTTDEKIRQLILTNKLLAMLDDIYCGNSNDFNTTEISDISSKIILIDHINLYGQFAEQIKNHYNRKLNPNELIDLYPLLKENPTMLCFLGEIYKSYKNGESNANKIFTEALEILDNNFISSELTSSYSLRYLLLLNRAKARYLMGDYIGSKTDYEQSHLFLPTKWSYNLYELLKEKGYY